MKTVKNTGVYRSLVAQLEKVARHNRQGSYRTRERYYEANKRFCAFLADHYHLQKLANVSGKHLTSYVIYLQENGKSPSTIKTDLAAIRFFHDKMPDARYRLPDNDQLSVELERRRFGGVDRTWSKGEYDRFTKLAKSEGHDDYAAVVCLSCYMGLRIHECFRMDTAMAERGLRENALTVKGKGGKVRTVPVPPEVRAVLEQALQITQRGHKLFVADDIPTDIAINRIQQYIDRVRPLVQDADSQRPMTHHGLRHTFAAHTYRRMIESGSSPLEASLAVSRLLGHERPDVTRIYLASYQEY